MINSIVLNKKPRCSLDLSLHVLEVMEAIINSSDLNTEIVIKTKPEKPKYLDENEIINLKSS